MIGKIQYRNLFLNFIITFFACFYSEIAVNSQANANSTEQLAGDSLSLNQVISQVIQNYPTVKEAEEALNAADAKIGLARAGYFPTIDGTASYSRLGPAPSITFPNLGSFQLFPADNYSASVNYSQSIFDFGKTARNITFEKENKEVTKQSLEQVKQKLAMAVTINFYLLAYLQEAIEIKNEELHNLQEHLEYVQKKKETGSATQYEILTTQVRISNVESQKLDLETSLKVQFSILNSLMGQPENSAHLMKKEIAVALPIIQQDSLILYALNNRDEIKIAQQKESLAELHYNVVKADYYPSVNIFASGGGKNGYLMDLNKFRADFVAGAGLNIPIFNATRTRSNLLLAKSSIQTLGFETDLAKRNITNEVVESETDVTSSNQKVKQFKLQLNHALEALSLAKVNFNTGVITNLDLLDATTAVSESQLSLLKAQIDYVVSIFKLKAALGERLY